MNAGDFLIEKRTLELLREFVPNSEITIANRVGVDYSERVDFLNSFDVILFAGGPIYQKDIYPQAIPFVNQEYLCGVKTPIMFIGGGLWHAGSMTASTRSFFEKGACNYPLGCRDALTYYYLRQEGFKNLLLTGCPAWYDLKHIENKKTRIPNWGYIQKIRVSEPASPVHVSMMFKLVAALREKFPDADISLIIHRERKAEIESGLKRLKSELGISVLPISGSADGFSVYDDCDLHVGFRVHAHIYNLSQRNISILLNEDMRGVGVN